MGRKVVAGVLVLAVLAAVAAVQLAGAAPSPSDRIPTSGRVFMNPVDPFTGKVKVSNDLKECRGPRPIRILNADTRAVVARATTDKTGHWSKSRPFFIGTVFADAPGALGGCPRMRPSVVRHFGPVAPIPTITADLAISKVAVAPDVANQARYTITVTNLGPGQADGVVVTDNPDTAAGSFFVATGSDPRCGPDGGAPFTCGIGTLTAGSATTLVVRTSCPGDGTFNSASVSSAISDPNTANNAISNVASSPCV